MRLNAEDKWKMIQSPLNTSRVVKAGLNIEIEFLYQVKLRNIRWIAAGRRFAVLAEWRVDLENLELFRQDSGLLH